MAVLLSRPIKSWSHRSRDNRGTLLNEWAYKRIRLAILKETFGVREPLSEGRLARRLGISRTPVREALKRLAVEGLVEIFPRRGTFVSFPSMEQVVEIFQLREALEGMAARLATRRANKAELEQFRDALEKAYRRREASAVFEVGRSFHAWIIAECGNRRLTEYLVTLRLQIQAVFAMAVRLPGQMERSYREYQAIIAAMKDGDAERAEQLMREHIDSVRSHLLKI